jgi:heme/copper-type cytochrome/quinol oxidase subunit 3
MAASIGIDSRHLLPASTREHPPGWWAMVCLIITEGALFAYFLFSYFYLESMSPQWPPNNLPELKLAGPNTVILIASSFVIWWAARGIKSGEQIRLRIGLLITAIMGIVFLVIQSREYAGLKFTASSHAYGSLFITITAFHFAHVVVGVLMILTTALRAWLGHFTAHRHLAVTNTALYWHFVDVVWLFVFTSLYLTPRIWWHT